MRKMFLSMVVAVSAVGCLTGGGERAAIQAVAGPGGVTATVRAAGELAVNWTADPAATKYYVYQASGGNPLAYAASVIGAPPATSYVATGLIGGVVYCYAIESGYADGTMSGLGTTGCATATGSGGGGVRTLVVPVVGPVASGTQVALFAQVTGLESNPATGPTNLYVPLGLQVGTTIVTIRARVQDGGPTRVRPTLMHQHDGPPTQTLAALVDGPVSSGSGAEETLSFSPNIVTAAGDQYVVKFANVAGFLSTSIFRLEVDVTP